MDDSAERDDLDVPETIAEGQEDDTSNHIEGDAMLNFLIHFAELGIGSGITLLTGGMVLSGVLISKRKFFEETLAFSKTGGGNPISILFQQLTDAMDPIDPEAPAINYGFVHLRDAKVMAAGQVGLPNGGTLMRIARSDIIGWSLGQLVASSD